MKKTPAAEQNSAQPSFPTPCSNFRFQIENQILSCKKSFTVSSKAIMTEFSKSTMTKVWEGIWDEMEGVLEADTEKFLVDIWKGVKWFCNGESGS